MLELSTGTLNVSVPTNSENCTSSAVRVPFVSSGDSKVKLTTILPQDATILMILLVDTFKASAMLYLVVFKKSALVVEFERITQSASKLSDKRACGPVITTGLPPPPPPKSPPKTEHDGLKIAKTLSESLTNNTKTTKNQRNGLETQAKAPMTSVTRPDTLYSGIL